MSGVFGTFDPDTVALASRLAEAAYLKDEELETRLGEIGGWTNVTSTVVGQPLGNGMFASDNSRAYIGRDGGGDGTTVVLSFMGTWGAEEVDAQEDLPGELQQFVPLITAMLNYIAAQNAAGHPVEEIMVVGHSLGGQISEALTQFWSNSGFQPPVPVTVYTFGSPGIELEDALEVNSFWHDRLFEFGFEEDKFFGHDIPLDLGDIDDNNRPGTVYTAVVGNLGPDLREEHSIALYVDRLDQLADSDLSELDMPSVSLRFGSDGDNDFEVSPGLFYLGGRGDDEVTVTDTGPNFVEGGDDNDILTGGAATDNFAGGAGNDQLFGLGASDRLFGGAGNDLLDGGADGDFLTAGTGNDVLYGGAAGSGSDWMIGGDGMDTVYGGDDVDVLFGDDVAPLPVTGGPDQLFGGDGADYINGGLGNDQIQGDAAADWMEAGDGDDTIYGGADGDFINAEAGNDLVYGGDDAGDGIFGHDGNDILYGGTGIDWMWGDDFAGTFLGLDTLFGGTGTDVMFLGNGDDLAYGGDDGDYVDGLGGNNRIFGGLGNDFMVASGGIDLIDGGDGGDVIGGGAGNDTLYGGAGIDLIYGGAANDVIDAGAGDGDLIFGDAGADTLVVGLAAGWDQLADWDDGLDRIDLSAFDFAGFGALTVSGSGNVHVSGAGGFNLNVSLDGGETLDGTDFLF